jgi:hypothetical protein
MFSREIGISACFISTGVTLGHIMYDCHKQELKTQKKEYEKKILDYQMEINNLKDVLLEKF